MGTSLSTFSIFVNNQKSNPVHKDGSPDCTPVGSLISPKMCFKVKGIEER